MKKLFFMVACLVALAASPVLAQTGGPDVVVVRIEERIESATLTIERAGQAPENIKFEYDRRPEKGARASKGYLEALSKLYQQGYLIQATIPGIAYTSVPAGVSYCTLIFTKPSPK